MAALGGGRGHAVHGMLTSVSPSCLRSSGSWAGLLLPKALFSVLVAVPAIAWIVARVLDLPRGDAIGLMLMAIAPGAPVALRRSLGAGGHRFFAPALQISVAILAVVSMPLSIAALNSITRVRQPSILATSRARSSSAQLLPLGARHGDAALRPRVHLVEA